MTRGLAGLLALCVLSGCAGPDPRPTPEPVSRCGYCAAALEQAQPTCDDCRATAVESGQDAGAARRRAEEALHARFQLRIPRGVRVSLTVLDPADLRSLGGGVPDSSEGAGHHLLAFTEVEELLRDGEPVDLSFRIYLARGTPAPWACGILAHELFHVWQTLQGGGPTQRDAFREGAAQYVQHEVLEQLAEPSWAKRVSDDSDPVYGDGLRRFRALVLSKGERRALELAGRAADFPSGY